MYFPVEKSSRIEVRGLQKTADSLPNDIDALRALALSAIAERDAAIAERNRLTAMNDRPRRLLRKAQGFEDQLYLVLEDIELADTNYPC